MQQSDYILREIEKINMLIIALLGKLKRAREEEPAINEFVKNTALELKEGSNLDLQDLLDCPADELGKFLEMNPGFDGANTELLSEFLVDLSQFTFQPEGQKMLRKALELYAYIDVRYKSFSLYRSGKMDEIKALLEKVDES